MLCRVCKQFNWREALCSGKQWRHHESYGELAESATQGCDFCQVAHVSVIDTYAEELRIPHNDVVRLHREQDRLETNVDEANTSCFLIQAEFVKVDRDFASFEEGIYGITYLRMAAIEDPDDLLLPFAEVYPLLTLTTLRGKF